MDTQLAMEICNNNVKALMLAIFKNKDVNEALKMAGLIDRYQKNQLLDEEVMQLHKKGYSHRKIAGIVGVVRSTVHTIIHRNMSHGH